ncbi:hypothetical protein KCU69_g44, partial [Aureobasidium melanogenum]
MPKDNEKSIFSTITAAVRPQDTATMSQSAQDTPKLACTPRPLAQPRRYGPGTGYEVRMPANMTPARIYRSSFGPDTRQMRNAATAHQESERRILPIGELITSHGNRTYTLWANEQHKTTNRIAIQVIITNNNSTTTFKSYSGVSRRSPLEVLDDFGSLLRLFVCRLHRQGLEGVEGRNSACCQMKAVERECVLPLDRVVVDNVTGVLRGFLALEASNCCSPHKHNTSALNCDEFRLLQMPFCLVLS